MKKLILPMIITASVLTIFTCHHAEAEETKKIIPTETIAPFPYEVEENENVKYEPPRFKIYEPVIKYASCETPIYNRPVLDDTFIRDYSLVNTSFDVIDENETWSTITTSDGYAYIQTKDLANEPVEIKTYTEEELYIMAHLLAGECQGYPDDEQLRVGSVTLNRVKDDRYPDTLKEVIFQPGQYACTWDGNYDRKPTERNWENAKWLLENGSILPEYVIYQSGGKQGTGVYYKSDWHYFCY